jgi:uncharacterized membrane protein
LADNLLCAGQLSANIRDALVDVWPNYEWFVLVQDNTQGWYATWSGNTEFYQADNICGKNLVAWMYSGSVQNCNANIAGASAQRLIDNASSSGTPSAIK